MPMPSKNNSQILLPFLRFEDGTSRLHFPWTAPLAALHNIVNSSPYTFATVHSLFELIHSLSFACSINFYIYWFRTFAKKSLEPYSLYDIDDHLLSCASHDARALYLARTTRYQQFRLVHWQYLWPLLH